MKDELGGQGNESENIRSSACTLISEEGMCLKYLLKIAKKNTAEKEPQSTGVFCCVRGTFIE